MREKLEKEYKAALYMVGVGINNNLAQNFFKQAYAEIILLNILSIHSMDKLSLSDFYRKYFPENNEIYSDYERMTEHYSRLTTTNILHSMNRGNKRFDKVLIKNVDQARSLLAIKLIEPNLSFSEVKSDELTKLNKLMKSINKENQEIAKSDEPKLKYNDKIKYNQYLDLHKYFVEEIKHYPKQNRLYSLYTLEKDMSFLFFQRSLKCLHIYNSRLRSKRANATQRKEKVGKLAKIIIQVFINIDLTLLKNYVLRGLELIISETEIDKLEKDIQGYFVTTLKVQRALTIIRKEICKPLSATEIFQEKQHVDLNILNQYLHPFYLTKNKDFSVGIVTLLSKAIMDMKSIIEN
ncbi:hypothetical protein CW683_11215 [Macrococcoides caseolyticum]|nr:hypothetical protein CW683_11215 [Macrococcus caseolyticus]